MRQPHYRIIKSAVWGLIYVVRSDGYIVPYREQKMQWPTRAAARAWIRKQQARNRRVARGGGR